MSKARSSNRVVWSNLKTDGFALAVPRPRHEHSSSAPADHRHRSRERLHARLKAHPVPGLGREQIQKHFDGMPAHYWERVTKTELIWGLETINAFIEKGERALVGSGLAVADARHYPERGFSKVMICTWDRPGLLAKIAAAFAVLRINVMRAEVYTRSDGLALDMFQVSELEHESLTRPNRLAELVFVLEGALTEPPRFVSLWAAEFHKTQPRLGTRMPRVEIDNDASGEHTLIRVEALDRLGLLHDMLQALTDCGLDIVEAAVETDHALASDQFYVIDLKRRKVTDPSRLDKIREALKEAAS